MRIKTTTNDKIFNFNILSKFKLVRDELTLRASDNEDNPDSPISFQLIENIRFQWHKITQMFNLMRDELTFNADNNIDAPDSPILFSFEFEKKNNVRYHQLSRFNSVREEFTLIASDNEVAPESPIKLTNYIIQSFPNNWNYNQYSMKKLMNWL